MRPALLCLFLGSCAPALTPEQQAEGGRDLVIAAHRGQVGEVRRLLHLGVSVDSRCGETPRETFVGKGGGWPIAAAQWTALMAAAGSDHAPAEPSGHLEVVRLLILRKANLNLHDGYGATALYSAVYQARWRPECEPIVMALLEAGAEVNTRTGVYIDGPGNNTPLHRAVGKPALVKALLDRGAHANTATTSGDAALHWAVRAGDIECTRLLIAAGADVNLQDKSGRSPLHWVSTSQRMKEMAEIVEKDGTLDAETKVRVLKLMVERAEPPGELENLLRDAGAKD